MGGVGAGIYSGAADMDGAGPRPGVDDLDDGWLTMGGGLPLVGDAGAGIGRG
jgi:hypothetical protein